MIGFAVLAAAPVYVVAGAILTDSGGFQFSSLATSARSPTKALFSGRTWDGPNIPHPPGKIHEIQQALVRTSDGPHSASSIPPTTRALWKRSDATTGWRADAAITRRTCQCFNYAREVFVPIVQGEPHAICAVKARAKLVASISPDTPSAALPSENRTRSPAK